MRLLTTDELFAVSGGSVYGENDPLSLNGNQDSTDWCSKIKDDRTRDVCYARKQLSQDCTGGWTEKTDGGSATREGIQGRSTTVECKTSKSNDKGSDSDNS